MYLRFIVKIFFFLFQYTSCRVDRCSVNQIREEADIGLELGLSVFNAVTVSGVLTVSQLMISVDTRPAAVTCNL